MAGERVGLLVNPRAGRGAAGRLAEHVIKRLRGHGLEVEVWTSRAPGVAGWSSLPRTEHLRALVVLGGDGAVHQAVNRVAGTGIPLGILAAGSANDAARGLGVAGTVRPTEVDELAGAVRAGQARPVDAVRVDGATEARWYLTVLSAGFDAQVNARAGRLHIPVRSARYLAATLAELPRLRPFELVAELDGTRLATGAVLVAVGNTPYYGAGMRICPAAAADDGTLDVTVVGALPRRKLLGWLPTVYRGAHVRHAAVRTATARAVRLGGDPVPAQADGEPVGRLPLELRCVPGAIRLLG